METRRARRYACGEGVDCEWQGRVLFASLRDISLLGARLCGVGLPQPGALVRVTPSQPCFGWGWVYCQVCWVRRGDTDQAGLRFLEPLFRLRRAWVGLFLPEDDAVERRQSVRVPTDLHVEVRLDGLRRPFEARSLDLSQGGAQIRLPRPLRRGAQAELYVCLPWCLLELPAQVTRRAPGDRLVHSMRFLETSSFDQEALGTFLREELPQSPPPRLKK